MKPRRVAYFSMEIALDSAIPTYSGGLGVLAGDTVRAAADLGVPMVAVTLLYRRGYFHQSVGPGGEQVEHSVAWKVDAYLEELEPRVELELEGRKVLVRAYRRTVTGLGGFTVPVYFLDTGLPDNDALDRELTGRLYGGDAAYRLRQEAVLGIGGARMLAALGHDAIARYHMNEGHSSLLTLELLLRRAGAGRAIGPSEIEEVRDLCVFTTHTPVAAGHDRFPQALARRVLGAHPALDLPEVCLHEGVLNMTYLALNLSRYINGVAKSHGEVARRLLSTQTVAGSWEIDTITNGVHAGTWTAPELAALYDRYIPGWRGDNFILRSALGIPGGLLWAAHAAQKRELIERVNRETNAGLDVDALTFGFARRMTGYKRPTLVLEDLERLRAIAAHTGPLQFVFAGKAHPHDSEGRDAIRRIIEAGAAAHGDVRVAFLENYDMDAALLLVSGSDVWLNTPHRPFEASGTSGMKAALNGVPSLSVLDGWWIEGCIEGETGWSVGERGGEEGAGALYAKIESKVAPLYYSDRGGFIDVMRHAIALNGSFFNTQRMLQQYVLRAYFGAQASRPALRAVSLPK